jgi:hypothetical protein
VYLSASRVQVNASTESLLVLFSAEASMFSFPTDLRPLFLLPQLDSCIPLTWGKSKTFPS